MQWEYTRVVLDFRPTGTTAHYRGVNEPDGDTVLQGMGAQGWELVAVTPRIEHAASGTSYTPDIVWGFFKRAKREETPK
jgi:hypothetical protein